VAGPIAAIAPTPTLDRAAIIVAVAKASDALAAGRPHGSAELAGRRFQVRLPFGCPGDDGESAFLRAVFNEKTRTLRLTAAVQDWKAAPWARALVPGENVEAIEGFWIRRPWLLTDVCPAQPAQAGGAISPETLGLAQVFEKGSSRLARRERRPYSVTLKLMEGEAPPVGGFRLVLEGRLSGAEGGPIRCLSDDPDLRPTCFVLAQYDRVAIEDAAGDLLGEWPS
jgi:hypothetical protein